MTVDDIPEDLIESDNSVGESATIKIIDLCLGVKSIRELCHDSDTRSENKDVKDFLSEYRVQAELILVDKKEKTYSIKRDLYLRGSEYILDESYNQNDSWSELKKLLFNSSESNLTFGQLIPKFVRSGSAAEDKVVEYLPMMTTSGDYGAIYSLLFQICIEKLISKKNELVRRIAECQKIIQALEKSENIASLSLLKQSSEIIDSDPTDLYKKRQ